jgi:hypothetical protein
MRPAANSNGAHTTVASIAAIGSILLAWSCCLPILPFIFAAGFASSSTVLITWRPYLLGLSMLFVGYGSFQAWRARQCNSQPSVLSSILLWTSAVLVIFSIFFPQVLADAAANLLAR